MSRKKKFLSFVAAVILSLSLVFGAPAKTSAATADLIGAAIQIGVESAALNSQINANIKHFNETEAGRQELYQKFREKYGVCEDAEYNAALDRIMANLTKGVTAVDPTIKSKPYLYFVSNDESVNAQRRRTCGDCRARDGSRAKRSRRQRAEESSPQTGHGKLGECGCRHDDRRRRIDFVGRSSRAQSDGCSRQQEV